MALTNKPDMLMKFLKLLPVFFVILMPGCDKVDDSLDTLPIDSIILISAMETSGEIKLHCQTKKEYECFNYRILTNNRTDQKSIEISFKGIEGENEGFWWELYVPIFYDFAQSNLVEPFSYYISVSQGDKATNRLAKNEDKFNRFTNWFEK